jgi:hypothetical protein
MPLENPPPPEFFCGGGGGELGGGFDAMFDFSRIIRTSAARFLELLRRGGITVGPADLGELGRDMPDTEKT